MMKQKKFAVKFLSTLVAALILGWMTLPASAQSDLQNGVLRVEVQAEHDANVKISMPLDLLETLYTVMPTEIHQACENLDLTPKQILAELENLKGEDLVRVTGENQVRVWFETNPPENPKELNMVYVYVKENGDKGNEVQVKVPKGLVKLCAKVIKELGLVDEYVKLPPELRQALTKFQKSE